jgi:hypothetical protein
VHHLCELHVCHCPACKAAAVEAHVDVVSANAPLNLLMRRCAFARGPEVEHHPPSLVEPGLPQPVFRNTATSS